MKRVDVGAAVILRPGSAYPPEFLLGQRAPGTFYPGYWEFPGGKVESGETPRQAVARELREELGIEVDTAYPWLVREHVYEHAHVRLYFFRITAWHGELRDHVHVALEWQRADTLSVAPMLPANAPVLKALALPDFYAITHAHAIGIEAQLAALKKALEAGVKLVQLREAMLPELARESFAAQAVALCQQHGARILVNGDAELARAVGADGMHMTAAQLMACRRRPELPLVAASCHNAHELLHAAFLDLDFVVLGPVKPTASHPGREGMGWAHFEELLEKCPLPVYALGGMNREDMESAFLAGAHGVAAIRGAWL